MKQRGRIGVILLVGFVLCLHMASPAFGAAFSPIPFRGQVRIRQIYVGNPTFEGLVRERMEIDAQYAKSVFSQVGLDIIVEPSVIRTTDAAGQPLPADDTTATVHNLLKEFAAEPDVVPCFYVKSLDAAEGEVLFGQAMPQHQRAGLNLPMAGLCVKYSWPYTEFMEGGSENWTPYDTLAHELGHLLLNDTTFKASCDHHHPLKNALLGSPRQRLLPVALPDSNKPGFTFNLASGNCRIDFSLMGTLTCGHLGINQVEAMFTRSTHVKVTETNPCGLQLWLGAYMPGPSIQNPTDITVINNVDTTALQWGRPSSIPVLQNVMTTVFEPREDTVAQVEVSTWARLLDMWTMEICVDIRSDAALQLSPPEGYVPLKQWDLNRSWDPIVISFLPTPGFESRSDHSVYVAREGGNLQKLGPGSFEVSEGLFSNGGIHQYPYSIAIERAELKDAVLLRWTFNVPAHDAANSVGDPLAIIGDVNKDGTVDFLDIAILQAHQGSQSRAYDLTGDGRVDIGDVQALVTEQMRTRMGDANLDGSVDHTDLLILSEHFGKAGLWSQGDFDGDGVVGESDLVLLAAHWQAAPIVSHGYSMPLGNNPETPPSLSDVKPSDESHSPKGNRQVDFRFSNLMADGYAIEWSHNVTAEAISVSQEGQCFTFSYAQEWPNDEWVSWTLNPTGSTASITQGGKEGSFQDMWGNVLPAISGRFFSSKELAPPNDDLEYFTDISFAKAASIDGPGRLAAGSQLAALAEYVVVADGESGVKIFDLSQPRNPALVWHYSADIVQHCAVWENCLVMSTFRGGLTFVDAENPRSPELRGVLPRSSEFYMTRERLSFYEGYVYGSYGDATMFVARATDMLNPIRLSEVFTKGDCRDVTVRGQYAYVAADQEGLQVFDVSQKNAPRHVGSSIWPDDVTVGRYASGVAVAGDYAYLGCGLAGLLVVDVSEPANPRHRLTYRTPWTRMNAYKPVVVGRNLYVAGNGLRVFDISDPGNPRLIGTFEDDKMDAVDVAVSKGVISLLDNDGTIHILLAEARALQRLAQHPLSIQTDWDVTAVHVAVQGGHAFLAEKAGGLQIIDVRDRSDLRTIGSFATDGQVWGVNVAGDQAFLSIPNYESIGIVDVSDMARPRLDTLFDSDAVIERTFVEGEYLYAAAGDRGLQILDVGTSDRPRLLSEIKHDGSAYQVVVRDAIAYVVDWNGGLDVIDVSDSQQPRRIGSSPTPGPVWSVALHGNYALIACDRVGVHVVDISDPMKPVGVSTFPTDDAVYDLAVWGQHAYLALSQNGIEVLDLSSPRDPRSLGRSNKFQANAVVVDETGIYVAAGRDGLIVLNPFTSQQRTQLRFSSIVVDVAHGTELRIIGPAGSNAQVQSSQDLIHWTDWHPISLGEQPSLIMDFDTAQRHRFYRIIQR